MSSADMGYAQAISEGNSLSRSVAAHNEGIREQTQILTQSWRNTIKQDKDKKEQDKIVHTSEDAYGGMTALGTIGQGVSRVKQLGFVGTMKADLQDQINTAKSVVNYVRGGQATPQAVQQTATDAVAKPGAEPSTAQPAEPAQPQPKPTDPAPTDPDPPASSGAASSTNSSEAGNVATDVSKADAPATEEVAGKIMKGVKIAGKVGKVAGVVGGAISLGTGINDVADGDFKKMDTAHKVSSIWGDISGALDIASVFIPVLAPLAAVSSIGSAIDSTVTSAVDDSNKVTSDQNTEKTQVNQNNASIQSAPGFTTMSIVANAQQDATKSIAGSSSF